MADNNLVLYIILALVAVTLVYAVYSFNSMPEPEPVVVPDVPTAQEIAAEIDIDVPSYDLEETRQIWEATHRRAIGRFQRAAIDACEDEFDIRDIEDLFGQYAEVDFVREYEDDRDFEVIDLGLDDEDDRHAILTGVMKFEVDEDYQDIVYGECTVTSRHGELDADLDFYL